MSRGKKQTIATLGKRIVYERERLGLNQRQLAEKTGLTQQGLRSIEHGRVHPHPGTLQLIASALDIEKEALLCEQPALPTKRRLTVEVDLPPEITDQQAAKLKKLLHEIAKTWLHYTSEN